MISSYLLNTIHLRLPIALDLLVTRRHTLVWVRTPAADFGILALNSANVKRISWVAELIWKIEVSTIPWSWHWWTICKLALSHVFLFFSLFSKETNPFWPWRVLKVGRLMLTIIKIRIFIGMIWLSVHVWTTMVSGWILIIHWPLFHHFAIDAKIFAAIVTVLENVSHGHTLSSHWHAHYEWLKLFGPAVVEQLIV